MARRLAPEDLALERLCRHHDISEFDCRVDEVNIILHAYANDVSHLYDVFRSYSDVTVLVLADGFKVEGYISYKEFRAVPASGEEPPLSLFLVPAIGVNKRYQRGSGAARDKLINAALDDLAARRRHGQVFDGIGAIPGRSRSMQRWLRKRGFKPLRPGHLVWWRRLD